MCDNWKEMFEKYSKVDFDTKIRDWARYYYYDPSDAINANFIPEDVTVKDVIVTLLNKEDIYEREKGMLPVSVVNKPIGERMASTIRHNRARGSHDVDLMSNIVKELKDMGKTDKWIMKHLGMDADEVIRLKQMSGLASLFRNEEFSNSWDIE